MSTVIKINDEVISSEGFIKTLKLANEFPQLIERLIRDKVTVHAAKQKGIKVTVDEVQKMANDFRRYTDLHRAKDTQLWMDELGITLEDFEIFLEEQLYKTKMIASLTTEEAVEEYFKLNSPRFDSCNLRHIVVDSESQARELMALAEEMPDKFETFVSEHSLDEETSGNGGLIKGIRRGDLADEADAKVFNTKEGEIVGPFQLGMEDLWEIFRVEAFHSARLNDATKSEIADAIYEEWLAARMEECSISI